MKIRIILRILGLLAVLLGTIMLIPGIVSAIYKEPLGVVAFGISSLLAIIAGLILKHFGERSDMGRKDAFAAVSFGWLMAGLIGALPYLLLGLGPVDAFFESMSGFTTTGATILSHYDSQYYWILSQEVVRSSLAYALVERATHQLIHWSPAGIIELGFGISLDFIDLLTIKGSYFGLLFWRSFSQFLGGLGIILLFIAILPNLGVAGRELYSVEGLGLMKEALTPRVKSAAKAFWGIYLGLAGLEALLLVAAGLPLFDSLCTSFSSISTAGFSPRAYSIAEYNSILVEAIICIFLLLGGTNFIIYHQIVLKKNLNYLLKDAEFRGYIFIMFIAIIILILFGQIPGGMTNALRSSVFQVISTMTTTGFVNNFEYDAWSLAAKLVLLLLMTIGGCTGSTGGGMKVGRVIIVLKYVHAELIRSLHPKAVITIKMADKVVRENTVRAVVLFVQLYIMIFILATLIFSITESSNPQFGALSAISAAACSLGIIGPGFGVVAMDFNAVSDGGKILAVFCMYIGRLEILPVVLMFLPETWSE
ncbi:MAG: potassium transporter TrkG [Methanothrix sp.]|jgi:trk system potassium uptake protein TrkH|uniref:TrkH family potassium uptake protein n=1 Tax=Methanothrix sp. TaxID=90426 RepID=UPI003BB19566